MESYFDGIFCINLKSREDRWTDCLEEFKKCRFTKVERVFGVEGIPDDGRTFGNMRLEPNGEDFLKKRAGRVGCLLSHLQVLREARSRKYRRILILEDDVQFVPDIVDRFKALEDEIPENYSLLYFGGNEKKGTTKVGNHIYRVSYMLMAHAVVVDGRAYDKLIGLMEGYEWPADVCYAMLQADHPCYVINPFLAWQRAGWSDIEQRFRLYDLESSQPYTRGLLT